MSTQFERALAEDASEPAIALGGVVKHYGAVRAVDGVDLDIRRGEVFGLIGHNGAGKSTLFKMMLGLIAPTAGRLQVAGVAVDARAFRDVRRHIGYLPENVVLYDNLSGLETLRFFARLKRAPLADCAAVLDRVGLGAAAGRAVREYSKGMRQRLGFAQALLGQPRVLFLDEPTGGLDPEAARDMHATLRALRDQGVTIVVTSHVLAELQERVDRLAIMAGGRLRALGSVQSLRENADLPLRLSARAADNAPASAALRQALAALPLTEPQWRGAQLSARCPRPAKRALQAALVGLGEQLADWQIDEASLEDLFFEHGGQRDA